MPSPQRYRILFLLALLALLTYLDRVCFGAVAKHIQEEFDFSDTGKGLIFGAFAFAYAIFEVPSGWLGDRFGPKKTLVRIVLAWSVFTVLTGLVWPIPGWPWLGFLQLLVIRFLFGAGEAGAFPNISRALHNWFPLNERGFAQGAIWMAGRFGGGITPFLVALLLGWLTVSGQPANWRPIFWVFGGLGVMWCLLFLRYFQDRPAEATNAPDSHSHAGVPWRQLLTSTNFWVLCAMYFCTAYGWYFNITYLPGFLSQKFKLESTSTVYALLAGAPLLAGALACLAGGVLSDALVRRWGLKWGRRGGGVLGHTICAACYFAAIFADSLYFFVAAITLAAFWNDVTMGSSWATCQDIGGKHTGVVAGGMNTIGNLGGALAGVATGMILDWTKPAGEEWNSLGWTLNLASYGGVYLISVLLWLRLDASNPVFTSVPSRLEEGEG